MITRIRQEQALAATPVQIFQALTEASQFGSLTDAPAAIDPTAGGEFSLFGGAIVGRTIEMVPAVRLVQAWRAASWDAGAYSLVRFDLVPDGDRTMVTLDHTGFPEAQGEHLAGGWHPNYWEPLRRRFPEA